MAILQGPAPSLRGVGGRVVLLQTCAPTCTSGFGYRHRRTIVARLMPYQTTPLPRLSLAKRSATVREIRRPRTTESATSTRKYAKRKNVEKLFTATFGTIVPTRAIAATP